MSDDVFRLSAEEAFEQPDMSYHEFDSIVDSSLQPRSPDVLIDLMEPSEFERLCGPLGVCADNLSRDYFEAAFRDSGFQVAEYERIDGEWREWREEEGDSKTSRQLLRISRMLRNRDNLLTRVSRKDYEIELADCYWGVYHMIGKMSGVIYILQKRAK